MLHGIVKGPEVPNQGGAMQDPGCGLPRISLPRTRVNRPLPEPLSRDGDKVIMKMLGSAGSSRKGGPMVLIRLEHHEHPAPPQHEMRQKTVLDSGDENVGTVANLYVDEDSRQLHFLDVITDDQHYIFLGLEKKHHLVPVEAVSEEDSGSITPKRLYRARRPSRTRMSGPTRSTSAPSANITATVSRSPNFAGFTFPALRGRRARWDGGPRGGARGARRWSGETDAHLEPGRPSPDL